MNTAFKPFDVLKKSEAKVAMETMWRYLHDDKEKEVNLR